MKAPPKPFAAHCAACKIDVLPFGLPSTTINLSVKTSENAIQVETITMLISNIKAV